MGTHTGAVALAAWVLISAAVPDLGLLGSLGGSHNLELYEILRSLRTNSSFLVKTV